MFISIPGRRALVIDKNEQKTSNPKKINHHARWLHPASLC